MIMEWFTDTAVYCLTDFITKSITWLLNGHVSMIQLLPIRIDPDGIPVFRLLLNDIPTLPGVKFAKLFSCPEKFNLHFVMYFLSVPTPFCIIKAFYFHILYAIIDLVKSQIFLALQILIGRISLQCHHCQCPQTKEHHRRWQNTLLPRPNFSTFPYQFTILQTLALIPENLQQPLVTTNQINAIGCHSGQSHLTNVFHNDTHHFGPVRL
jgi:hypothetical protein